MRGHRLSLAAALPKACRRGSLTKGRTSRYNQIGLDALHRLSRLSTGRATRVPDRADTQGPQRTTTVTVTRPQSWPSIGLAA
jgi:hypothetical protein